MHKLKIEIDEYYNECKESITKMRKAVYTSPSYYDYLHDSRMEIANKRIQEWVKNGDKDQILDLSDLKLTKLPTIPKNVQYLDCTNNQLTVLPKLPNVRILYCGFNRLTVLPELPNAKEVYCYHNELTVKPELP
jgi:Leucine-rich repeat (LRR) protein